MRNVTNILWFVGKRKLNYGRKWRLNGTTMLFTIYK